MNFPETIGQLNRDGVRAVTTDHLVRMLPEPDDVFAAQADCPCVLLTDGNYLHVDCDRKTEVWAWHFLPSGKGKALWQAQTRRGRVQALAKDLSEAPSHLTDDDLFARLVWKSLDLKLTTSRELAEVVGVNVNSVKQWASGSSAPHSSLRRQVFAFLLRCTRGES